MIAFPLKGVFLELNGAVIGRRGSRAVERNGIRGIAVISYCVAVGYKHGCNHGIGGCKNKSAGRAVVFQRARARKLRISRQGITLGCGNLIYQVAVSVVAVNGLFNSIVYHQIHLMQIMVIHINGVVGLVVIRIQGLACIKICGAVVNSGVCRNIPAEIAVTVSRSFRTVTVISAADE